MTSDRGAATAARLSSGNAGAGGERGSLADLGYAIRPHNCFACGELNAHGLHLRLHLEHERCWVELPIGREFEGWEGIVHGGILSTILDEVMAWSLLSHDTWGVTARLSVAFRKPVAVGARVRAEGWVVDARRRTFRTAGRVADERGVELASADGLYVAAPEDRKEALRERYGFRTLNMPAVVDGPTVGRTLGQDAVEERA